MIDIPQLSAFRHLLYCTVLYYTVLYCTPYSMVTSLYRFHLIFFYLVLDSIHRLLVNQPAYEFRRFSYLLVYYEMVNCLMNMVPFPSTAVRRVQFIVEVSSNLYKLRRFVLCVAWQYRRRHSCEDGGFNNKLSLISVFEHHTIVIQIGYSPSYSRS